METSITSAERQPVEEDLNLYNMHLRVTKRALEKSGGHRAKAAQLLGIGERTIYHYINKLKFYEKKASKETTKGGLRYV